MYEIRKTPFDVEEASIEAKLDEIEQAAPNRSTDPEQSKNWGEAELDDKYMLAKFALLRYDELNELAHRLARILIANPRTPVKIDTALLEEALKQIDDSEWRKNKSYVDYLRDRKSERRDYQMLNVWEVKASNDVSPPGVASFNGSKWLAKAADALSEIKIQGFELLPAPPGGVEIRALVSK